MEKVNHNSNIVILGQMVLDTVITSPSPSYPKKILNFSQNIQTIGGPPTFSGITSIQLSKIFPWIKPPLIYAYTCDLAIKQMKKLNDSNILLNNLVRRDRCPQFRLIYQHNEKERDIYLYNPPLQFNPSDFNWNFIKPPIAIVGSVYNEFDDPEIFRFLQKKCDFVAYDPQGHFRTVNFDGHVINTDWKDLNILSNINCLKISELEALSMGLGSDFFEIIYNLLSQTLKVILLTRGKKGCILGINKSNKEKKIYIIPAFTNGMVIDETGAGDVFLSAFITHFKTQNNELAAAAFATSIASLLIEKPNYQGNFFKETINFRQELIETQIHEVSSY